MAAKVDLDKELPIQEHRKPILRHIRDHRITCIHGETGCGKSSMVPKFILDHFGRDRSREFGPISHHCDVNIVVTQPRRLAAITLAKRVAKQYGENVGGTVGYRIGGDSNCSGSTRICYVTTGLLLQMFTNNPESFKRYSHIILDEIHERQIDCDLLSLVVKLLASENDGFNTRIIVMSATLEGKLFHRYFSLSFNDQGDEAQNKDGDEVIFVGAKHYSIKEVYLDDLISDDHYLRLLGDEDTVAVKKACDKFNKHTPPGGGAYHRGKDFSVKPNICEGLEYVCITLIMELMKPGETILVFLPGLGEIQLLHDELSEFEMYPEDCPCAFQLFALYSRIPKEDQMRIADTEPPKNKAHVILATNIAESSLTLPKVRYVIDFGLRRHMVYVPERRMNCLMKTWISQASAQQRKGRTGRVFDGTVIRLFTHYFFYQCMPKFDQSEIQMAPLDKLVLQARQVGSKLMGGMGPCNLLSLTINPPDKMNVEAAITRLADAGALTAATEMAEMTSMALLILHLPLDLSLCRLIFFGIIFNCATDAVVMAAALSMRHEAFTMPSKTVMKNIEEFRDSLVRSFLTRNYFDDGEYSEPIMALEMFRIWIANKFESINTKSKKDQIGRFDPVQRAWQKFQRHAVKQERLIEMETEVVGIATRVLKLVPPQSDSYKRLMALIEAIRTECIPQPPRVQALSRQKRKIAREVSSPASDPWMFTDDKLVLKFVLTAAFTPNFLCGTADGVVNTKKGPTEKGKKLLSDLEEASFTVERSIVLNDVPPPLHRDPELCQKMLGQMVPVKKKTKHETFKDGRMFLEFTKYDKQSSHVAYDVTWWAHLVAQVGEGRDKFAWPGLPQNMSPQRDRRSQAKLSRPNHPNKVKWKYFDQTLAAADFIQGQPMGWRNPVGFVCERRSHVTHYAVAAGVQGSFDRNRLLLSGMTILPSDCDGLLATSAMLTFLPGCYPLSIIIESDDKHFSKIKSLKFIGHNMSLSENKPMTLGLLVRINMVRQRVSQVLRQDFYEGKLPDINLQHLLCHLVEYIFNRDKRKKPSGSSSKCDTEALKEKEVVIFQPQLAHAWSRDSLDSTDSENDTDTDTHEDEPNEFCYLQEYNGRDWFPHVAKNQHQKQLKAQEAAMKRLCPNNGTEGRPANAEELLFEDGWE